MVNVVMSPYPRWSRLPELAWCIEWLFAQTSNGVKVNMPIARPTQSLAALLLKKLPWPQSCWIRNSRSMKPAAGIIRAIDSQMLIDCASQASTQSAMNGTPVTAISKMLRHMSGSRYLASTRIRSRGGMTGGRRPEILGHQAVPFRDASIPVPSKAATGIEYAPEIPA